MMRRYNRAVQLPNEANGLTKIVADDLEDDQVSSLVEFMTVMSNGQLAQRGKTIEVTGLSNKKIKFLLKKFLYTRHLPGRGVLDTAGAFEIVHVKQEESRTEQHETLSPTMPSLYGIPHPVKPSDMIEWQGQPPTKRIRQRKE